MNSVTQQHSYGCGIACTAFVSDREYKSIVEEIGETQAQDRGFYCVELVSILNQLGLEYGWKFVTDKIYSDGIDEGSIIYLKRSNLYPEGHYLARTKNAWMDPWINLNENDDVSKAKSGFIDHLPYRPSFVIRPSGGNR